MSYHFSSYIIQPKTSYFGLVHKNSADVLTELEQFVHHHVNKFAAREYTVSNVNITEMKAQLVGLYKKWMSDHKLHSRPIRIMLESNDNFTEFALWFDLELTIPGHLDSKYKYMTPAYDEHKAIAISGICKKYHFPEPEDPERIVVVSFRGQKSEMPYREYCKFKSDMINFGGAEPTYEEVTQKQQQQQPFELPERPKLSISVYKLNQYTIDNYSPDYPYLVTVDGGETDEYWWVGKEEAEDLEHSCVTDKYKQLLYTYEIRHLAKEPDNAQEKTDKA
jgi:hypothetical protein